MVFTTFIIFMIIINTNGGYIKTYEDVEYFISNPYRVSCNAIKKKLKKNNKIDFRQIGTERLNIAKISTKN